MTRHGADGYVSLEVSPHLAHDTERTISEAKRLRAAVDRPNVMIKVPATPAGIPAIEELIADGVNVNVTLMFSMSHYEAVARAYIKGLERCADPAKVASVASFFVSRVDTMVDKALEEDRHAARRWRCGERSPSPIPKSSTGVSWKFFTAKALRRCASAARGCSGRCGRARARRIPDYSDVLYVENLDRTRDGQHLAARDDERVSRPRQDSRRDGERRFARGR